MANYSLRGCGTPDFLGVIFEIDKTGCFTVLMLFSLMRGPTLKEMLEKNNIPHPTERCIRWFRQLLCTLEHMEKRGITHNDIHRKYKEKLFHY